VVETLLTKSIYYHKHPKSAGFFHKKNIYFSEKIPFKRNTYNFEKDHFVFR